MMKRLGLALAAYALAFGCATAALAEGGGNLPPVDHPATLKECGDCHIPFPPQMLPMRSWQTIMSDLADHFGDNATLPDKTRADIEAYLVANAADTPGNDFKRFLRGTPPAATPLRITETNFWKNAHGEVSASAFADPKIKTRANCIACHRSAKQGLFGEEE
jgi:mono/diheme cytochrome c family protein